MANNDYWQGNFYGRTLISRQSKIGGAKNVFVKLGGIKDELVFPTFGGTIMNPFKGQAKLYAGDLAEYRTDSEGVRPTYWILKTFLVEAQSGTTVKIVRDGYKHIPFVGDVLMKAPDVIGGAGKAATVTAVAEGTEGTVDVWVLTLSDALTLSKGDILVEGETNADSKGSNDTHVMVVKKINSVCPCDYDFRYPGGNPAANDHDYSVGEYDVTLALGGTMYAHKMSPMPKCVLDLNTANVTGWYKVNYDNFLQHKFAAAVAALEARVTELES